uniref:Uncharacterized protein n=1 Tax=Anguilla anguilla TaxID=7936 RepID=A0A0E9T3R5_ANGAN
MKYLALAFAPVHAASSSPWCLFHAIASVE